jgi:ABC-2 type transport system permease protein
VAWLGFAVAVVLALLVSFAVRFLVASTSFWLLDASGPNAVAFLMAAFFSGLTVPLVIFPGWSRDVVMALPWASYIQVPADIWLGKREGWDLLAGLGFGVLWAVVLFAACHLVLRRATRKVVVQGG